MGDMLLKVGLLAQRTGKTARALHFYEELGLIRPTKRTKGGFRLFDPADVERIAAIERLHEAGFTLDEISKMVGIMRSSPRGAKAAEQVRKVLARGIAAAKEKIAKLQTLLREIEQAESFLRVCCEGEARSLQFWCSDCRSGVSSGRIPDWVSRLR